MVARGGVDARSSRSRRAGLRAPAALGLTAVMLAAPAVTSAAASPMNARLEYVLGNGATSCPPEAVFRASVGAQVDHPVFLAEASTRLRVVLARRTGDGRYEADLQLDETRGGPIHRHQAVPPMVRCSDVVQAAAVLVAEMLDPIQAEPSPPGAPSSRPPPTVLEVSPRPAPERASWEIRAVIDSWVGLGVAPRPAAGVSFGAGLRWSPVSLSAEVRWDPPASADVGGGARLSTRRLLGALVPCGHWSKESFGLFGCAVGQMGVITGENVSVSGAPSSGALYAAAGARLGAELRLTPLTPHLGLRLSCEGLAKVQGGTFVLGDNASWRTPPVAGDVGLGVIALW